MKEYLISGLVTVSCWTKVKANSKDDAIKEANSRELAYAHIDGTFLENECFHFTNDGQPYDLKVDE